MRSLPAGHPSTLRIRLYILRKGLPRHSYFKDGIGTLNLFQGGEWNLRVGHDCLVVKRRILPPRLAPWRYERGARSLLVNFAQATGSENAKTLAVGANTTLAEEET